MGRGGIFVRRCVWECVKEEGRSAGARGGRVWQGLLWYGRRERGGGGQEGLPTPRRRHGPQPAQQTTSQTRAAAQASHQSWTAGATIAYSLSALLLTTRTSWSESESSSRANEGFLRTGPRTHKSTSRGSSSENVVAAEPGVVGLTSTCAALALPMHAVSTGEACSLAAGRQRHCAAPMRAGARGPNRALALPVGRWARALRRGEGWGAGAAAARLAAIVRPGPARQVPRCGRQRPRRPPSPPSRAGRRSAGSPTGACGREEPLAHLRCRCGLLFSVVVRLRGTGVSSPETRHGACGCVSAQGLCCLCVARTRRTGRGGAGVNGG